MAPISLSIHHATSLTRVITIVCARLMAQERGVRSRALTAVNVDATPEEAVGAERGAKCSSLLG